MLHIRTRLFRHLENKLGLVPRRKVVASFLDRTYVVIQGSVRTDDYDDAWLLALGLRSRIIFDIGCNTGQASLLLLYSGKVRCRHHRSSLRDLNQKVGAFLGHSPCVLN